jgi:conjugative transposon TraM protein
MKKQTLSPKMLRQRKFLLVVPLLVVPFITLFFWALGGGTNPADAKDNGPKGFNMTLPDAKLKDGKGLNKMSYYDQASLDSVKLKEQMKNDPYYHQHSDSTSFPTLNKKNVLGNDSGGTAFQSSPGISNDRAANEAKVYQKLAQLKTVINRPVIAADNPNNSNTGESVNNTDAIERQQRNLQHINNQSSDDPEMKQMNGMLEKILDIQHPGRAEEKIKENSEAHRGQVFAVSAGNQDSPVSLLDNGATSEISTGIDRHLINQGTGFYSLDDRLQTDNANTIPAVVHETQTLVNGSVIKLRLLNAVYINGVLIPKDNFLFGTVSLNGERLGIKINSIRYVNSLFPVALSVYDLDGLEGIDIPGAISRDVAKSSADQAMQNLGLSSYDPSLGAQAASAGIEAAKTLFSKKVKLIKVTVKAGYQVLLYDEKQKANK